MGSGHYFWPTTTTKLDARREFWSKSNPKNSYPTWKKWPNLRYSLNWLDAFIIWVRIAMKPDRIQTYTSDPALCLISHIISYFLSDLRIRYGSFGYWYRSHMHIRNMIFLVFGFRCGKILNIWIQIQTIKIVFLPSRDRWIPGNICFVFIPRRGQKKN
jgi:hypothetical protein